MTPRHARPAETADLVVRARGLTKTFRTGQRRALAGLDFEARAGDMTAIVGPSGSGKSTLLYALSGLIDLDAGDVTICGETPATRAQWTRARQTRIGLVFQDDWLLPTLTAAQNVELPMIGVVADADARRARVRTLLARVNAEALAERMPDGLSGGERQRIAVARGLANGPSILLADEPTGELDSANSRTIVALLQELREKEGLTVLIVTHDPAVAAACDRRYVLTDGLGRYDDAPARGTAPAGSS